MLLNKKILIIIVIISVSILTAAYFLPTGGISPQGLCQFFAFYPSVTAQMAVGVITFVFEFMIPIVLIIYGYSMIAWSLHKRVQMTSDITNPRVAGRTLADVDAAGQAKDSPTDAEVVAAAVKEPKKNEGMAKARRNVLRTSAAIAFFFIFSWSFNEARNLLINLYVMNLRC